MLQVALDTVRQSDNHNTYLILEDLIRTAIMRSIYPNATATHSQIILRKKYKVTFTLIKELQECLTEAPIIPQKKSVSFDYNFTKLAIKVNSSDDEYKPINTRRIELLKNVNAQIDGEWSDCVMLELLRKWIFTPLNTHRNLRECLDFAEALTAAIPEYNIRICDNIYEYISEYKSCISMLMQLHARPVTRKATGHS
jgi:hypothetical protein